MLALIIITFVVIYTIFLWTNETRRINSLITNIPRIKSFPIIGSAFALNVQLHEFLLKIENFRKEHGPIHCGRFGTETVIFLTSVEHSEEVMASSRVIEKGFVYKFVFSWVGTGLVTAPGDLWRKNRKLIAPTFHNKILEDFVDVFNSNSSILINVLKDKVGGPGFDVYKYINLCALDIIFETSIGLEINAQKSELSNDGQRSPIIHIIHELVYCLVRRISRPWLYPELFFRISPTGRKYFKDLKQWKDVIRQIIKSRRERRLKEKSRQTTVSNNDESELTGTKRKEAFLDLLLDYTDAGVDWTDYDLESEVSTMIVAGHDTVTSAISFALYALSDKPDIQDKILKELNEIFGDSDRDPTFNDLQKMKYLEKVMKEVLRMYPSVPYIARRMTEDFKLKTGHILPKGSTAFMIIKLIHYDPEVYPEPEVFNPERFSYENSKGRSPYAFCPFSAGPRSCLGQKYGLLEMKCVLSKVLRNYKILPAVGFPGLEIYSDIILRSKTGINVRLANR